MNTTSISTILVEANGCKGGFDITITHFPDDSHEMETFTSWANRIQGVEEEIRRFRIAHDL
jgi:hypothetical protein